MCLSTTLAIFGDRHCMPVVPHKAVAEVSKIGNCRNPLMDRKVVGVVLFGVVAVVTSPTTAGCSVVYCSVV